MVGGQINEKVEGGLGGGKETKMVSFVKLRDVGVPMC